MIIQWENIATSSFILWLDHEILTRGQAFTNVSSKFYQMPQTINGLYTYALPFSQLVSDFSINNANIPTGVYLNNTFITVGQSGLSGINYSKGQAYFTQNIGSNVLVSGNYAVKDINVVMPNISDANALFETKLPIRSKIGLDPNNFTGVQNNEIGYPAIFVRNVGGENVPYGFGGTDETLTEIELYIFTDSLFLIDAVKSIIKDRKYNYIPIISENSMPFNNLGYFKNNTLYNYNNLTSGLVAAGSGIFVKDLTITDFNRRGLSQEIQNLTQDCYFAVVDITLSKPRLT